MRLKKFQVKAFRCIYDSGLVLVSDAVALIGKNESGKTTLLEALAHLNKDYPIDEPPPFRRQSQMAARREAFSRRQRRFNPNK